MGKDRLRRCPMLALIPRILSGTSGLLRTNVAKTSCKPIAVEKSPSHHQTPAKSGCRKLRSDTAAVESAPGNATDIWS